MLPASLKFRVAARAPVALGAKLIVAAQLAPAARLEPQVLAVTEKSPEFAPVMVTLLMDTAALLPLVRVAVLAEPVWPNGTSPQTMDDGDAVSGPAALAPVPDNVTESGVAEALLVMLHVAERAPAAVGAKVMFATQLAAWARLGPQLVEATA